MSSERLLQQVLTSTPVVLWAVDAAGVFTLSTGQGLERLGLRPGQVVGLSVFEVYQGEPELLEHVRRALRGDAHEARVTSAGRVFDCWFGPLRGAAGEIVGASGVATDVTEKHDAQRLVEEWEARYEAAVRVTGGILYDWEPATGAIVWGGALEQILGWSVAEMEGGLDRWFELIHPEDQAAAAAAVEQVKTQRAPFHLEYRMRRKDGSWASIHDDGQFFRDARGEIRRMVGMMSDVTQQKQLQDQYLHAQKMEGIGRLAGGIAHDFNNLLTAVLGYAAILLRRHPPGDAERPEIEEIRKAGERAASLTRQLLAFSRRQVMQPRALDVRAVLSDMESLLRRLIGEDIELETRVAGGLPHVRADRGQLEQVLVNLAVNARDAMPSGGRLVISAEPADGPPPADGPEPPSPGTFVRFSVTDTGAGMTAEVRRRAFEPFFTTKEPGKGTGLGLATVYGIVTQSGGTVAIASAPGAGTTVSFLLPAARAEAAEERAAAAAPADRGVEHVLLVEDEPTVRHLCAAVLREHGYQVHEATDGTEALALLQSETPAFQLLVTDVIMPRMGGRELARQAAALRPGLRVLLMTGYAEECLPGDLGVLLKPFLPEELAARVRALLDRPA